MIGVNQRVRLPVPVTVWVRREVQLSGEYVVEKVRRNDVRIAGVWIPKRLVEAVR
jgi:hypothetical protein